jgi:hypothetical protein
VSRAAGLGWNEEATCTVHVRPTSAPCSGRVNERAYQQQRPAAASTSRFAGVDVGSTVGRARACCGAGCSGSYSAGHAGDGCASCTGPAWSVGWNAAESRAAAFHCPADSRPWDGSGVCSPGSYRHHQSSSSRISYNSPGASMHCMPYDGGVEGCKPWPAALQPQLRSSEGARLQQQSQHRQQHQAGQLYGMPIASWVLPGQGSTDHACDRQAGSTTCHVSHTGSTSSLEAPRTPDPPPAAAAAGADMYIHSSSGRYGYHDSAGGVPVRPSTAPDLQRSSAAWMYSSTRSSTSSGATGGATSAAGTYSSRGAAGSLWCEVVHECRAEVLEQAMLLSQTASVAAESRVMAAALRSSWDLLHS